VQYFKQAIGDNGVVIATDCSPIAPAIYEADKYYIVPRITEPGYIERILEICRCEQVSGVLSLIDPELSMLAEHTEAFRNVGTTVIGSDLECCDRALDKWKMFCWLKEHDYLCARSYLSVADFYTDRDNGLIDFPVFVKAKFYFHITL
jgi:carbamoyl-phosphate synthase large subunit